MSSSPLVKRWDQVISLTLKFKEVTILQRISAEGFLGALLAFFSNLATRPDVKVQKLIVKFNGFQCRFLSLIEITQNTTPYRIGYVDKSNNILNLYENMVVEVLEDVIAAPISNASELINPVSSCRDSLSSFLLNHPDDEKVPELTAVYAKLNGFPSLFESSLKNFLLTSSSISNEVKVIEIYETISEVLKNVDFMQKISFRSDSPANASTTIISAFQVVELSFSKLEKVLDLSFFKPEKIPQSAIVSFREYLIIARSLTSGSEDRILTDIRNLIARITESVWNRSAEDRSKVWMLDFPFIAVVGPSLMGKTQLAFTLARKQPVIYLNFSFGEQSVYKAFEPISVAMSECVETDLKLFDASIKGSFGPGTMYLLENLNLKYTSLGLIYSLIKRGASFCFNSDNDWMNYFVNLDTLVYSKMSIPEFYTETALLFEKHPSMKLPVVFIDEFQKQEKVLFVRNLARAVALPGILASTNAKVSNMIVYSSKSTRSDRKLWCHVITCLPPVSIQGILQVITIPRFPKYEEEQNRPITTLSNKPQLPLISFLDPSRSTSCVGLLSSIGVLLADSEVNLINRIIELIKIQSHTCLQGISYLAFESLAVLLTKLAQNNELKVESTISNLWDLFIEYITDDILKRKESLSEESSLYFSMDTFSLFPSQSNLKGEYSEGPASISINDHLYFLGTKRPFFTEPPSSTAVSQNIITLTRNLKKNIFRGEDQFILNSYFSQFEEDVFTHMAVWKFISKVDISLSNNRQIRTTLASVVQKYFLESYKPLNVMAPISDHEAQERLALWAVANASHQDSSGEIDGVTFFKEFAIQVQSLKNELASTSQQLRCFIPECPEKLQFFLSKISCPYYIPQVLNARNSENLIRILSTVTKTGICRRLRNIDGFDISFEISGFSQLGYVECKNLKSNVTRQLAKTYIIRAMNRNTPVTILLTRTAGRSLRSMDQFNKFIDEKVKAETKAKAKAKLEVQAQAGTEISKEQEEKEKEKEKEKLPANVELELAAAAAEDDEDGSDSFEEMIAKAQAAGILTGNLNLNIYSLVYSDTSNKRAAESPLSLGMEFVVLHEVKDGEHYGVFIIVESNCKIESPIC